MQKVFLELLITIIFLMEAWIVIPMVDDLFKYIFKHLLDVLSVIILYVFLYALVMTWYYTYVSQI